MSFQRSVIGEVIGVQTVAMLETEAEKVEVSLGDNLAVAKSGKLEHTFYHFNYFVVDYFSHGVWVVKAEVFTRPKFKCKLFLPKHVMKYVATH